MYLRSFHPVIIRNEFAENIFISCLSITAYHNCERSSPGAQKHLCHISRTGLRLHNFFQFSTPLMKRWVLSSSSCALFHNCSGKMLRSSVIIDTENSISDPDICLTKVILGIVIEMKRYYLSLIKIFCSKCFLIFSLWNSFSNKIGRKWKKNAQNFPGLRDCIERQILKRFSSLVGIFQ